MELSLKQINELLTGVVLAQELRPVSDGTRRFITVRSFEKTENGIRPWNKNLPSEADLTNAVFCVRVYSLRKELIEADLDLDERDTSEHIFIENIKTIHDLYKLLPEYLNDPGGLVPQWECDNPIE